MDQKSEILIVLLETPEIRKSTFLEERTHKVHSLICLSLMKKLTNGLKFKGLGKLHLQWRCILDIFGMISKAVLSCLFLGEELMI